MSKGLEAAREELSSLFGSMIRYDRLERELYSHDIGIMPGLIKPITGLGIAGAVVQPSSTEEIIQLMKIAQKYSLGVTPRGAGTSGYGGAIPNEGALVVDLGRLTGVVKRDGLEVTVKPGTVWKDLEEHLGKEGLALRLYPSSAPSSTVGGWLAQGGSGIGSYQYGWFRENVVSAVVVLPNGETKRYTSNDMDLVADLNGTTGIITEVTLKVREQEDEKVIAVAFDDSKSLKNTITELSKKEAPLWSIGFINPQTVKLKALVPAKTHHGHPIDTHAPVLPESFIALFVCTSKDYHAVESIINKTVTENGAKVLSEEIADHEWSQRFNPMKVKRIGPSMIAAEVVVPLDKLESVLNEIDEKVKLPYAIEGTMVGRDKVVLLALIPHDERSFKFTVAYGLSLSINKIAKSYGGRVYTTGVYFRNEAPAVLGDKRVENLLKYKQKIDPEGRFNKGKVIGDGLLNSVMSLAGTFEPVIRIFANAAKAPIGERFGKEINGIPGDVIRYAYACAQCGYCEKGCTQFAGRGWLSHSPRGKWFMLRSVVEGRHKITQEDLDHFLVCTTCEQCDVVCQLDLPIEPSWMKLRGKFINENGKMTFPAFEMMAASARKELNIWADFAKDRDRWMKDLPEDVKEHFKEKSEIAYFAGCTASFIEDDISKASATLLAKAGVDFAYLGDKEACCGIPMLVAGRWDVFEEILRHNVKHMKETGAKTVVTSCPACWLTWNTVYPDWAKKLGIEYDFEAKHYSQVLAERIKEGKLTFEHEVPMKVTFHDSCHIGRAGGVYEPPRELLKAVPGTEFVEMEHNRENGFCCGSVLTLIGETPVAPKLGKRRVDEAVRAGADAVVALCPCCEFQLRVAADKEKLNIPVIDLAAFAAKGLGVTFPDTMNYALEQWVIFEKMIYLMKPDAMVELMDKLMPELVNAMPGPFPAMMRFMAKIPGALSAMRPVMPKMMPIMLPGMMPKVMPAMLVEVGKVMGELPDNLEKQMPELLPKTMETLMPNMLPVIAPGVTDKMIAYLKGSNKTA
jgi:Fe-S oxidoreductase/FAD/FMN-containing dehydrogenase